MRLRVRRLRVDAGRQVGVDGLRRAQRLEGVVCLVARRRSRETARWRIVVVERIRAFAVWAGWWRCGVGRRAVDASSAINPVRWG